MKLDGIERAAEAIRGAGSIVITAGAGMGVDSGLPDFRGDEGFWKAYPPYRDLGISFMEMANPSWFERDPALAWGFYGHRRSLYRVTTPHRGFSILRCWGERASGGFFVFTSNVDGHFRKAGFCDERIIECHGSIEFEQCSVGCGEGLWAASPAPVVVDESVMRARGRLPACRACGAVARPNILMFFDGGWDTSRHQVQLERLERWLDEDADPLVVIECGAGSAVPTVRSFSEQLGEAGSLIRINPREPDVPDGQIGISLGALEALDEIEKAISSLGRASVARPSGTRPGLHQERSSEASPSPTLPQVGSSRGPVEVRVDAFVMDNIYGGLIDGISEGWQCQRFDAFLKSVRERWGERRTLIVGPDAGDVQAQRPGGPTALPERSSTSWGDTEAGELRAAVQTVGGAYAGQWRPPHVCAAWLVSYGTLAAQGSGDTYSELVVVWYQEYGEQGGLLPTRVSRAIDWHAHAWSCDP